MDRVASMAVARELVGHSTLVATFQPPFTIIIHQQPLSLPL
jgi:hypothetical protein